MKQLHILISGLVQGVFFRFYAQEKAQQLNIAGWVRNLNDGRTEILAIGEEEPLKQLLDWCYQGPSEARVEKVEFKWEEKVVDSSNFVIKH